VRRPSGKPLNETGVYCNGSRQRLKYLIQTAQRSECDANQQNSRKPYQQIMGRASWDVAHQRQAVEPIAPGARSRESLRGLQRHYGQTGVLSKLGLWFSARCNEIPVETTAVPCSVLYPWVKWRAAVSSEAKRKAGTRVPPKLEVEIAMSPFWWNVYAAKDTWWRESNIGTISLYDVLENANTSIYIGNSRVWQSDFQSAQSEKSVVLKPVIPKQPSRIAADCQTGTPTPGTGAHLPARPHWRT